MLRRVSHAVTCCLFAVLVVFGLMPGALAVPLLSMPGSIPSEPGQAALQTLLNDLARQRNLVIEIQRELVKRPALNPEHGGEGEEAKARWIESWLREKGLPHAERIDSPDERVPAKVRPNLIIRYPGVSRRTVWIVAHMDTSPSGPPELWTGSPWALRVVGDLIYGRGVEDNHQAITSGLLLLETLARNRITPPLSLGLVFTSGEKPGPPRLHGLEAVFSARPDLFGPNDLILMPDYGNKEGTIIEVAEKGLLWLKITVTGRQGTSAIPATGINALESGAALITDLGALSGLFPAENPLFFPPVSTFVPTAARSNASQINQIPGEFAFHLDCRLLAPYSLDAVQQAVRSLADAAEQRDRVRIAVERIMSVPAVPGTSPEVPVVQALMRAVHAHTGRAASVIGIGGVSMAREMRARNLPVAVWAMADSAGMGSNESVSITALLDMARIFARVLYDPEAANSLPEKETQDRTPSGRTDGAAR